MIIRTESGHQIILSKWLCTGPIRGAAMATAEKETFTAAECKRNQVDKTKLSGQNEIKGAPLSETLCLGFRIEDEGLRH